MIDAWSGPTPTAQQYPHKPEGWGVLIAKLRAIETRLGEVRSNLLANTGISIAPTGMTIDSALNVTGATDIDGTLNVDAATTIGGTLDVAGAMRVLGTLALPAGIIDNDALASPVEVGSCGLSNTSFGIPTTYGNVASGTIAIPAGYTRAVVLCIASVGAWNGSATSDYVYAHAVIDGTSGAALPEFAGPSSYRSVSASAIRSLDGLIGGGTISLATQCKAASGWGSSASNIANIDAIALFLR